MISKEAQRAAEARKEEIAQRSMRECEASDDAYFANHQGICPYCAGKTKRGWFSCKCQKCGAKFEKLGIGWPEY